MDNDWIKVEILTSTQGVEILTSALSDLGHNSLSVLDAADFINLMEGKYGAWDYIDPELMKLSEVETTVTFYIPSDSDEHDRLDEINEMLLRLKTGDRSGRFGKLDCGISYIADSDWGDSWKNDYDPIITGKKLAICPSWYDTSADKRLEERIKIYIDPGMAFGTGLDETTRLCLEALENATVKNCSVFDIGCGSGILAIGAILLGADSAFGIDIDKTAVKTAKENAELNGVSDKTEFAFNILSELPTKQHDIICANLSADTILNLLPEIKRFSKPTGTLILSGIIKQRENDIINALLDSGLSVKETKEENGWCCIQTRDDSRTGD